ncbi:hypothetical protein AB0K05_35885 [Nonomuraea sp. NPDC049486]|uniref:hypothetical protein n=1 Tax=unclassified Nonomuraea TaxID=2593643 RepID=UPI003417D5AA
MRVGEAVDTARRWVRDEGARLPGFGGAFLTGSALWAPPGSALPPHSDVDVMVVLDEPAGHGRKVRYGGALLDVSFLPATRVESAEAVLRDYHLAGAFHRPGVLADPTGRLRDLGREVSRRFAGRRWVLARCDHALETVRARLAGAGSPGPLPGQVNAWLFGTGVTAHVLLVAGLRNPTVRRRYAATRELLDGRGLADHHEHLLDLLGCATMTPGRVRRHLDGLERLFDTAARVDAPAYRFDSDITAAARPIAVGGSRALVDAGLHREAVFWLAATYARCLLKLAAAGRPAPEDALLELLSDLGADTPAARQARAATVLAALPSLRRTAGHLAPPA